MKFLLIINYNFLNDISTILTSLIVFIIGVILALSNNITEKNYQKKFIIVSYLLYYFGFIVLNLRFVEIFLIFLVIWLLSGINLVYSSESYALESELGKFKLILYKMLRWFFIIKGYFFLYGYIFYSFINRILQNYPQIYTKYGSWIQVFLVAIPMIYHLNENSTDSFDVLPFYMLRRRIVLAASKYFQPDINRGNVNYMLAYILFMEDKDFYTRSKPTVSFVCIIKRKLGQRHFFNYLKDFLRNIGKITKTSKKNNAVLLNKYKRGYSTPAMQYTRIYSMKPNSYKYTIRRKLFVEIIYLRFFWIAWRKYIRRIFKVNKLDADHFIRDMFLLAYFYDEPIDGELAICKLIDKFESRTTKTHYLNQWKLFEHHDSHLLKYKVNKSLELTYKLYNEWNGQYRVEKIKEKMEIEKKIKPKQHTL